LILEKVQRRFSEVDVFTAVAYRGNPLAVVIDSDGLAAEAMQRFANWTNLSETTFLLPPTTPKADYRVRIFTPMSELPFAGHPTLGSCHAWLAAGGQPKSADEIVQECGAGLVKIRRSGNELAFSAPPLIRSGSAEPSLVAHVASTLGIDQRAIVDAAWADNGPGWLALLLESAESVLGVRPGVVDMDVGLVGPYPARSEHAFEIRAFFPKDGSTAEDPVTGSLNASVAQWLIGSGRASPPYTVSQGTALGRAGRVKISTDGDGAVWVGGKTITCISGGVEL
jgi:PhzF family phenazine biosynthesis protein